MATYDYDVVNLALVRIGANRITSLTDGSKNASEANAIFSYIRDSEMRDHPWGFATRFQNLERVTANVLTVTGITKANPGVVTYTHVGYLDPEDGDCYKAENIVGMTEIEGVDFKIHAVNTGASTFKLYTMDGLALDTSTYVAVGTGGTFTRQIPPNANTWSHVYLLPARVLRVLEINDDPDEKFEVIELRYLLCNSDECLCKFITQVTDPTRWDQTFDSLLAWRLAAELAMPITGDKEKSAYAFQQYNFHAAKNRATDASEGKQDVQRDNRYVDSRR